MTPVILSRLQFQHLVLDSLLENVSSEKISTRPESGKWSILENICHLGRYQEIFLERIELVLQGEKPLFERYDATLDDGFTEWTKKDFEEILQELKISRISMIQRISALSEEEELHSGSHPVYGDMTIRAWCDFFLLHEAHHLFTILKLKA
ncbi:DinB superfamily protein [Pseudarcicella hirudinis]|uniref:DinB superfamily protein n=1 Tax=Pseudarcicella hirudinis TaxID=1079859 RepID=A0A1I5RC85_9BACT|nr:DinB family protein [Pseudarcicella hirudinis]SFP56158.1 DinB superfamily protein [Pseudarcicella hirudinis]